MKKFTDNFKHLFFAIAILLLAFSQAVNAQVAQKTFKVNGRTIKVDEFNKQVERIIDNASTPGLSLAIINQNKVVFYNTYGYKEIKKLPNGKIQGQGKIDKATLFEACSLSKSFFLFAVQRLVDKGVLNLDTPLYKYLTYPKLGYDERYKKITGRMVLSHSSGIENWESHNNPDKLEIISNPGEKFVYSGEGYIYLSKVIEKLLDKSTESYMNELVYRPLNLKHTFTTFPTNGADATDYALGHNFFLEPGSKEKNKSPNIAAFINTTANDYAELLVSFFNNKILSKERVDDITGVDNTKHYPVMDEHYYWGPGFAVNNEAGDTLLFQGGDNQGFKGWSFYSRRKKSGYVIFTNGDSGYRIVQAVNMLTTAHHHIYDFSNQYPNPMIEVLNKYNKQGYIPALNYFNTIASHKDVFTSKDDFDEWGNIFLDRGPELSASIAKVYESQYPASVNGFLLHGNAMMKLQRFKEAITDFKAAIKIDKNSHAQFEKLIDQCNEQIKKKSEEATPKPNYKAVIIAIRLII
jgi:CubicO group peptidase (beta-lactamase class C family)